MRYVDRAADWGFAAGWRLVRLLPERPAAALAADAGALLARRNSRGVRHLRSNLAVARPELCPRQLDGLVAAGMRSYARYWLEAFRLPTLDAAEIDARVRVEHETRVRRAFALGRGVVGALPHMGNYDLAGAWACTHGLPVTTVAERLQPESLYERFFDYRRALGMEILPLTGHQDDVLNVLIERLRGGRFVPLIADRDLSAGGIEVTMFGRLAKLPAGPAVLALRSRAPLLPVTACYEGPTLVVHVHREVPPGPVRQMVQQCADVFAAAIAEHPQDWHMLQRYFLDDAPDPRQ